MNIRCFIDVDIVHRGHVDGSELRPSVSCGGVGGHLSGPNGLSWQVNTESGFDCSSHRMRRKEHVERYVGLKASRIA